MNSLELMVARGLRARAETQRCTLEFGLLAELNRLALAKGREDKVFYTLSRAGYARVPTSIRHYAMDIAGDGPLQLRMF